MMSSKIIVFSVSVLTLIIVPFLSGTSVKASGSLNRLDYAPSVFGAAYEEGGCGLVNCTEEHDTWVLNDEEDCFEFINSSTTFASPDAEYVFAEAGFTNGSGSGGTMRRATYCITDCGDVTNGEDEYWRGATGSNGSGTRSQSKKFNCSGEEMPEEPAH